MHIFAVMKYLFELVDTSAVLLPEKAFTFG